MKRQIVFSGCLRCRRRYLQLTQGATSSCRVESTLAPPKSREVYLMVIVGCHTFPERAPSESPSMVRPSFRPRVSPPLPHHLPLRRQSLAAPATNTSPAQLPVAYRLRFATRPPKAVGIRPVRSRTRPASARRARKRARPHHSPTRGSHPLHWEHMLRTSWRTDRRAWDTCRNIGRATTSETSIRGRPNSKAARRNSWGVRPSGGRTDDEAFSMSRPPLGLSLEVVFPMA